MSPYPMHKKEREITDLKKMEGILKRGRYASLALCRRDEPYIVTLSYGYDEERRALYFHTALKGLKLEFLRENPAVCGTVILDRGYLEGKCAHGFRSVVFRGRMSVVNSLEEKKHGLAVLLRHQEKNPSEVRERLLQDDASYSRVAVLRMDIQEMTGKENP